MALDGWLKVRVGTAERGLWVRAAEAVGTDLSSWVRRALSEQAELDGALAREGAARAEERVVSRLFEKRGV